MADRLQSNLTTPPELQRLLDETRKKEVSEEELREQRISFAYGNASMSSVTTKESVRRTAGRIRLMPGPRI